MIVSLQLGASLLHAQTDVFLPDHEFLHSINLSSYYLNDVEQLFQNPSSLTYKENKEIFLMIQEQAWDYQQSHLAFIFPLQNFTFGVSIANFANNKIHLSPQTPPDIKPMITDYFNHQINTSSISISSYKWAFNPSLKLSYIAQKLADQNAAALSLDIGSMYWVNETFWLGAYSRYLNQPHLLWNKSNIAEKKTAEFIFESGLQFHSSAYRISATNKYARISSEWVYKLLSLRPDIVLNLNNKEIRTDIVRYGLGVSIAYKKAIFIYNYLVYHHQDLGEQRNQFGLTWIWN